MGLFAPSTLPPYRDTEAPVGEWCVLQGGGGAQGAKGASRSRGGGAEMEKEGTGAERVGGHDGGIMGPPPACCYVISEAAFAARM